MESSCSVWFHCCVYCISDSFSIQVPINEFRAVPNALEQLKALQLDDVEIVSDNGYCTEDNLLAMIMGGFKFITRIENDIQWISPLIDQYREELAFCGEIIHCDPKFSGISTMQMHTFQ